MLGELQLFRRHKGIHCVDCSERVQRPSLFSLADTPGPQLELARLLSNGPTAEIKQERLLSHLDR